jgi:O-antigen ligase
MTSFGTVATDQIRIWVSPERLRVAVLAGCAVLAGAAIGGLVTVGRWYAPLGLIVGLLGVSLLRRYRLAVITVWLLVAPFVVETDSTLLRKLFWLIHRGLPVAVLGVTVLGILVGDRRRSSRLGWPETFMGGYALASLLSIFYTSDDPLATAILFYDRVLIPMCLYLIIRLVEPDESELRQLVPVCVFILVTQSAFGVLQWIAPQLLPSAWLGLEGARTTGSLVHPNVFATTLLFCGLLSLHSALSVSRPRSSRWGLMILFLLSIVMVFLTFSRASWLAAIVVIGGLLFVYPRALRRLSLIAVPIVFLLLAAGLLSGIGKVAADRLESASSEQSALSRLPVAVAAVRMFEQRPLFGWGYENFQSYDRQFQTSVAGFYPDKDHASHNLFLTLLAEQGLLGFALYLGPTVWWLAVTPSALANMPQQGFLSRRLLIILWLIAGSFFIVNLFSNFRVTFGFGMWWVTLGLIGSLVDHYRPRPKQPDSEPLPSVVDATTSP